MWYFKKITASFQWAIHYQLLSEIKKNDADTARLSFGELVRICNFSHSYIT